LGRYKVEFSKQAAKDYKKLPQDYKVLIDLALARLSEGFVVDVRPIVGEKGVYRLRVGRYRLLFTIIAGETILIAKIGPRGDIYK
jgi:mRNA interferase RelE/StbE